VVLRKELEDFHTQSHNNKDVGEEGTSLIRRCDIHTRERNIYGT